MSTRILVFAGSAREGSLNKKLARLAAEAARAVGAEVTLIDLRDHPLPLYDGDLEAHHGVPVHAVRLKALFKEHDALLIASPENNGSVSALLKNTLDWLSRPVGEESGLAPYKSKVAALLAASPSALGGLRGLTHLRQILQSLGVLVLSEQFALSKAHQAFDAGGTLKDPKQQAQVAAVAARLAEVAGRLAPGA
jgi:NAD(P)H-dependent FMN reductase